MKTFTSILCLVSMISLSGQNINGAWKWQGADADGRQVTDVAIVADQFFSETRYDTNSGAFKRTTGGSWRLEENKWIKTIEFDTQDSAKVGAVNINQIQPGANKIVFVESGLTWERIDDGSPGKLAGAWLITGRKRGDQIVERDPYRPRKTMKILSGTQFQWIAYNTETKQFMGTGGGTYTTEDGKYVENIEFFSRDNSRVGASLDFSFELKDGKWHHSGKSSKGDPIYEIWSIRQR